KDVVKFTAKVTRDPSMRPSDATLETPLDKTGAWFIEGRVAEGGPVVARTVVILEKGALLLKETAQGQIAWVVDAKDGKPLANVKVEVFSYGSDWSQSREVRHSKKASVTTDAVGVAKLPKGQDSALVTPIVDGRRIIPV